MNENILRTAGIDFDLGVKRFVGRTHLFEKALSRFLRDSTFSRIQAAHDADDRGLLFSCVHEFKGMCGNIALTSLYEAADAVVKLLRDGELSQKQKEFDVAYDHLEKEYHVIYEAIRRAAEVSE